MAKHADGPAGCPLAAVDRRLEDAHRLWHQAEAAYFDPDAFRLNSQLVVQTLRTITFVLQNQKRRIPDFDVWYGTPKCDGVWQARLRDNRLMRWLVDARNKIEKQGDLEAESFVKAEIIASHLDEGPRMEVPASLFEGPEVLLRRIPPGAVAAQRRWVESSLRDFELLNALAIAYGHLAEPLHDAHRQMGLASPQTVDHETGERYEIAALGWRMPCMIGHDQPRALLLSLADGSRLSFHPERHKVDREEARATIVERYGAAVLDIFKRDITSNAELAENLFAAARFMFLRDGYHTPLLVLVRDFKPIKLFATPTKSRSQKYLLMRQLATEAVRYGADAAISIGEVWMAPASEITDYKSPSELPTRKEALGLVTVSRTGEPVQHLAMIERDRDKVSMGETFVTRGQPVLAVRALLPRLGTADPCVLDNRHSSGLKRKRNPTLSR